MPGLPPPPAPDSDEEQGDAKALVPVVSTGSSRALPKSGSGGKVAPAGRDFSVQPEELCSFMERAVTSKGSVEVLEREFNGIMGLAHTLRVNPALGLVRAVALCAGVIVSCVCCAPLDCAGRWRCDGR
jgi:hypothetical protein